MKTILFGDFVFSVSDDNVLTMDKCYNFAQQKQPVFEFDFAGGASSGRHNLFGSQQPGRLRYVSHNIQGSTMTLVQESSVSRVTSVYESFADTNAVRITHTLENISQENQCVEMTNTFNMLLEGDAIQTQNDWYLHHFENFRYTEGMPRVRSLSDWGMHWYNAAVSVCSFGNHSTAHYVPQGVMENRKTGDFLMFQIESYTDWIFEITAGNGRFHLRAGGPSARFHQWNRILTPGESYTTVPVALVYGNSLNSVLGQMTGYRRHIKGTCPSDAHLPSIYNEYMHYSWDDPIAQRVYETAPAVAATGCEYYIIDCGWHDPKRFDSTDGMYKQFGTWYEDRERFPEGIKAISDYIHSLGMKFGLWIAPEVVGVENEKMLSYYDESCFFIRNGEKVTHGTGYLLDFRSPKVYDYMEKTITRMVEEYGCDYIKFDGCASAGFGTEVDSTSLGDGLVRAYDAFLNWTGDMMKKYPNVIFEDCAGGGQRLDYKALSMFHLASTSDQTEYNYYPYIAANITASVLPEQAAVWSYPVDGKLFDPADPQATNDKVSRERVILNMINAFLGRIHLASRIQLLNAEKQQLIKEGVSLYNKLTPEKLTAVPYFPKGYTAFGDTCVAAGLKTDKKVYLAIWNLNGQRHITLPLPEITAADVKVLYPTTLPTSFAFDQKSVTVDFTEDEQARFFEITLG